MRISSCSLSETGAGEVAGGRSLGERCQQGEAMKIEVTGRAEPRRSRRRQWGMSHVRRCATLQVHAPFHHEGGNGIFDLVGRLPHIPPCGGAAFMPVSSSWSFLISFLTPFSRLYSSTSSIPSLSLWKCVFIAPVAMSIAADLLWVLVLVLCIKNLRRNPKDR